MASNAVENTFDMVSPISCLISSGVDGVLYNSMNLTSIGPLCSAGECFSAWINCEDDWEHT